MPYFIVDSFSGQKLYHIQIEKQKIIGNIRRQFRHPKVAVRSLIPHLNLPIRSEYFEKHSRVNQSGAR